jgi:hypothetical protein
MGDELIPEREWIAQFRERPKDRRDIVDSIVSHDPNLVVVISAKLHAGRLPEFMSLFARY